MIKNDFVPLKDNEWWISEEKQFLATTKRWYCRHCRRRTPIERNPEWDGKFRGTKPAPKWFTRCKYCHTKYWASSGFDCHNCGYDDLDETTVLKYGEEVISVYAQMELGCSHPVSWEETHKCPKCRSITTFVNSNY